MGIARALLVNPSILVLDDATSAIDVNIESKIHESLTRLLNKRTTILIAHRLSTINLADRVIVLDAELSVKDLQDQIFKEVKNRLDASLG